MFYHESIDGTVCTVSNTDKTSTATIGNFGAGVIVLWYDGVSVVSEIKSVDECFEVPFCLTPLPDIEITKHPEQTFARPENFRPRHSGFHFRPTFNRRMMHCNRND